MMMKVKKCVILAGGLSTRFYPVTKVIPKTMLPIGSKPIIQHIVEQVKEAGITEICIVTNPLQNVIEEHFSENLKLNDLLTEIGAKERLSVIKEIGEGVTLNIIKQVKRGGGGALMVTKKWVDNEPFLLVFSDEVSLDNPFPDLLTEYEKHKTHLIGTNNRSIKYKHLYGHVEVDKEGFITSLREKETHLNRPHINAVVGNFVLNATIFKDLAKLKPAPNGEYSLVDAIEMNLDNKKTRIVYINDCYDTGRFEGYVEINHEYFKRNY
jgi:UTP--glucose-1-phosphate uridylyltransferase